MEVWLDINPLDLIPERSSMANWPDVDADAVRGLASDEQRAFGRKWVDDGIRHVAAELGQTVQLIECLEDIRTDTWLFKVRRKPLPWVIVTVTTENIEDIHSTRESRDAVAADIRRMLPSTAPPLSGVGKPQRE
jgi:hypothetical protein